MFKTIKRIFILVLATALVAGLGLYMALRSSLPQTDGQITLNGPGADIEIIRDANAIPHIFAKSENDAFFALGFLHAQDRLWQLEMNRRIASGRLAEVLGEAALPTDKFLRTLGVYRAAQKGYDNSDENTRSMAQSYSAGINAFLEQRKGLMPPEFLLTGAKMEPWTPIDTLAWLKMMAWDLGGNWRDELARLEMIARLGPKRAAEFLPAYPGEGLHDLPELSEIYPGVNFKVGMAEKRAENLWAPISPAPRKWVGSNNWVVDGEWTKSGKPMLANDPHLGLTTPSIWYLAHFNINGKNLLGSTLPAVPFVVLGRNDRIAWGFTNTNPDVQDLYIERLVDESSYLTVDGPVAFETREEIIKVKDGEDVVLNVRESRHGPIMSDISKDMQTLLDDRHVMAFHWTALEDVDGSAGAGRQIVNSHDYQGLLKALMGFHAPEQNIVYADVDGNIGYIAPGKVPVRDPQSPTQGLLPARGWLGTDEWIGRIPFEELPQTYNPPSGMVQTANQKIVRDDYPHHITDDWSLPYRGNRIAKQLMASTQHDAESFIKIQMDPATDMAVELTEIMLSIGDFGGKHQELRDTLAKWDGGMWRDDAEPLVYAAWHRAIAKRIYEDDLKDRFSFYWDIRPDFLLPLFRGADYGEAWCDDQRTAAVESCATQVAAALNDAIAELTAAHGEDWQSWRWGNVHKVTHVHRPFSNVDALKSWFEIKDEADGGPYAINVSPLKFASEHPYESSDGPSYRAIYDLANLETSRYIIPGGQSGHFLSPHYGDLAPLWRDGKYIEISTSKEKIMSDAIGTLTLKAER